jgi:hypothetical protein
MPKRDRPVSPSLAYKFPGETSSTESATTDEVIDDIEAEDLGLHVDLSVLNECGLADEDKVDLTFDNDDDTIDDGDDSLDDDSESSKLIAYECPLSFGHEHVSPLMQSLLQKLSLRKVTDEDATRLLHPSLLESPAVSGAQLHAVVLAEDAFSRGESLFALLDQTGAGKTREFMCLAANELMTGRTDRVLILSCAFLYDTVVEESATMSFTELTGCTILNGRKGKFGANNKVVFLSTSLFFKERILKCINEWLASGSLPPLIIVDEAHALRNPSCLAASALLDILSTYNTTRVLLASATLATCLPELQLALQLADIAGTPSSRFRTFEAMRDRLRVHGTNGLYMVLACMAKRGICISRQLGLQGMEACSMQVSVSREYIRLHDAVVEAWQGIFAMKHLLAAEALRYIYSHSLWTANNVMELGVLSRAIEEARRVLADNGQVLFAITHTEGAPLHPPLRRTHCHRPLRDPPSFLCRQRGAPSFYQEARGARRHAQLPAHLNEANSKHAVLQQSTP